MIEYDYGDGPSSAVKVFLDKKHIGTIFPVFNGWRYYPTGSRQGGETYPTVQEVQYSLENDND